MQQIATQWAKVQRIIRDEEEQLLMHRRRGFEKESSMEIKGASSMKGCHQERGIIYEEALFMKKHHG